MGLAKIMAAEPPLMAGVTEEALGYMRQLARTSPVSPA
jgi:hypothetical protein